MKRERYALAPSSPYGDLSFKMFPEFLEWMISHRGDLDFYLRHGFGRWKDYYKETGKSDAVAEMSAYMTAFLNMVLIFDSDRGAISHDESIQCFHAWRDLIDDVAILFNIPLKMVTKTTSFHV